MKKKMSHIAHKNAVFDLKQKILGESSDKKTDSGRGKKMKASSVVHSENPLRTMKQPVRANSGIVGS